MGSKNTISPEQDFSKWSSLRLKRYQDDLEKLGSRQDRKIKDRVTGILNQREVDYQEYMKHHAVFVKEGKTINNMSPEEIDILRKGGKILDDRMFLNSYSVIPSSFAYLSILLAKKSLQPLTKSLQPDDLENHRKIKAIINNLKYDLSQLSDVDKTLIKIPEWWEGVLKEYSE